MTSLGMWQRDKVHERVEELRKGMGLGPTYVFGKYTSSARMPTCLALSSECTRLMPCLLPLELQASLTSGFELLSGMLPLSS